MSNNDQKRRIGDSLVLVGSGATATFGCGQCGHELGSAAENYKLQAKMIEQPINEVAPEFTADDVEMAQKMVFREFICPSCGVRFDTEIARKGDELLWDIKLALT